MLSGGQRQRTALARALALDRPILILDDTLSAVDAETEVAIQAELTRLYRGRTVIVVSHRVSALRDADQIVVSRRRGASKSSAPMPNSSAAVAGTRASLGPRLSRPNCSPSTARRTWHERRSTPRADSATFLQEEEALGKAYDVRLVRRLWPYIRPYRWQVVVTLALVAPLFALMFAPVFIREERSSTGSSARERRKRADSTSSSSNPAAGIPSSGLAGLYVASVIVHAGLDFVRMVLMAQTGQAAMRDLRRDVFAHVQRLHLGFFDRYPVGRLVTRTTNDVENVAEMFSQGIIAFITDLLIMVGIAAVLLAHDTKLALLTFCVVSGSRGGGGDLPFSRFARPTAWCGCASRGSIPSCRNASPA